MPELVEFPGGAWMPGSSFHWWRFHIFRRHQSSRLFHIARTHGRLGLWVGAHAYLFTYVRGTQSWK